MALKRWLACADLHGDKADKKAVDLLQQHVKEFKPQHRIFCGDIWDFRPWRRGADDLERREYVEDDFEAGMDFLTWFRPTAITLGNHDIRLWDVWENGGPMSEFCRGLIKRFEKLTRQLGTVVLPYDKRRIYRLGQMKFAHGFFSGPMAARQMAQAYGSIQFGHGHAIDVASTAADCVRAARMIGCLCRLDFSYNRAHVNALRQRHGWTYGYLFKNGLFQVFQAEVINQKIAVAQGIRVIG